MIKKNLLFLQNGKSSSSPTKTDSGSNGGGTPALIMPKKKPMQTPQDGVRSDLLKAIRDGKSAFEALQKQNKTMNELNVFFSISGIALKKVEQRENEKQEEANGVSSQTDVASILARRVAVEMSDSDNENASDSEYDSDDWGDESTA